MNRAQRREHGHLTRWREEWLDYWHNERLSLVLLLMGVALWSVVIAMEWL